MQGYRKNPDRKPFRHVLTGAGCALLLAGCATASTQYDAVSSGYNDPFEGMNRAVFAFNETFDTFLLEPVARGYEFVLPGPVRSSIGNLLANLRMPVNIANQVLQADFSGAGSDTTRFLVNTTAGIGGLFDVADDMGFATEHEDFGQTLASWGVGHGPYVVLPFIGGGSLRDHVGLGVDSYADPLRRYLYNTDRKGWHYARLGTTVIDRRADVLDVVDDLRENSLDFYATLRSVTYQRREALLNDADPEAMTAPEIPDYDDDDYE